MLLLFCYVWLGLIIRFLTSRYSFSLKTIVKSRQIQCTDITVLATVMRTIEKNIVPIYYNFNYVSIENNN